MGRDRKGYWAYATEGASRSFDRLRAALSAEVGTGRQLGRFASMPSTPSTP
jgi:hypothetical protein